MVTRLAGEDGFVNDPVIDRYRRFSEGGSGLVVVEASAVHGVKSGPLLRVSGDEHVPGLARLVSACREAGDSRVVLQIIHFLKIARSGWRQMVADLSKVDLEALPDLFVAAARRAEAAGFDGVELHMAHAYTLSSLLSRHNRRSDEYGRTLENRLRLPSVVLHAVRSAVSPSFGVGVRFDAEESIRRGYSVQEAIEMAVRFGELGASYVSLSAGGKFEDAVPRPGKPLYPYTGYSGDRCMPGDSYPNAVNMWMARAVRTGLRSHGLSTPVIGTGKVPSVELAEELLAGGACDIVGMARALLADPFLPRKTQEGRDDEIVRCIYCNVCKSLDENFKTVVCYLWPRGAIQAPRSGEIDAARASTCWPASDDVVRVTIEPGQVRLRWRAATDATGEGARYDVLRADGDASFTRLTSCSRTAYVDDQVVGGRNYRYRVVPFDAAGRRGQPSAAVAAAIPPLALERHDQEIVRG